MPEQGEMPISHTQEEDAEANSAGLGDEARQESKKHYTEKEKEKFYQILNKSLILTGTKTIDIVPIELHEYILKRLIEDGYSRHVMEFFEKFVDITQDTVEDLIFQLIETGYGKDVANNFLKFHDYNLDYYGIIYHLAKVGIYTPGPLFIVPIIPTYILSQLTAVGFRKISEIGSFLSKFESIIPNSSDKFTVEQVILLASEPKEDQEEILNILKTTPFLAEAFFANRYGIKLILKYPELDEESRENISLLYDVKKNRGNIEQDTPEFRGLVQERLATYKNNGEIVGALKEKGVDVQNWLNYPEQDQFDLGKEDDTSFTERIHLPITRLGESQQKYIKGFRETIKPYFAQLAQLSIAEETDKLKGELEKMKEAQEKARTDGNEKKADGIQKGIDSFQAKVDNPKQVPAWDRVMGDVAAVERFMADVTRSADATTAQEKIIAELIENPSAENRKKLIEAKTQNLALERKFRENLSSLDTRIADFEKNTDELLGKLIGEEEKEKIFAAFHELVLEDRDHITADIFALQKLLEDDEGEGENKTSLEGTPVSIGVWNRNPDEDLYLGNYTDCCIRIDSVHMGEESTIADYLTDLEMQVVAARNEKKNVPVVAAWSFIGKNMKTGEVALVIDNIEANTDYSIPFKNQLSEKLKTYFEKYAKSIGITKIVQGTANNDLEIFGMDGDYEKLGGYNRKGGYFLEGERVSEDDDEDDEEENNEWEENQEDEDIETSENEGMEETETDDYFDIEERLNGRKT